MAKALTCREIERFENTSWIAMEPPRPGCNCTLCCVTVCPGTYGG